MKIPIIGTSKSVPVFMNFRSIKTAFLLAFLGGATATASAQNYLDTVIFGNANSETAHAFVGPNTAVITNTAISPAQVARQGLTNNPVAVYGGALTFTLKVDPVWRNYFTVKLWGGDDIGPRTSQDADIGRLYLYVPASNFVASATNNYQVGYRHEGDYSELNTAAYKPPLPGRFFYSTTLLPLWMTQGRTNLTLTIQPGGRIYALGSGGPPSGNYQFNMFVNSRGIYQAYSHTEPALNPAGEAQGTAPATTVPTSPTSSVMNPNGHFNSNFYNDLNGPLYADPTTLSPYSTMLLAQAYSLKGWQTCTNPRVVTQVVASLDCWATNYYANPGLESGGGNNGWGGQFGPLGGAVYILSPQLQGLLDVTNVYWYTNYTYTTNGAVVTTNIATWSTNIWRRQAWGDLLLASRDFGRFSRDSRTLANQCLAANINIFWANRGLLALGNTNAFSEVDGQRYLKEAIGILPWLGSDLANGGHSCIFGTNYYMVTPKGLTKEWGYVGLGYGERQQLAANFYQWTTNPVFLAQCIKMTKARAPMRRPSSVMDGSGYDRTMEGLGLLSWRSVLESDSQYADDLAYGEPDGVYCAALTMDPSLIGYAKQMLADNRYFPMMYYAGAGQDTFNAWSDYQAVANAPDPGIRLPMSDGQPDFAWADEDNGIVVVKHGNERLWLSAYWEATGGGVNGIGRFLYETNTFARYGVLEESPQFNFSGAFVTLGNLVDLPYKTVYWPPDNPVQAYAGQRLPVAAGDGGAPFGAAPWAGRAQFWTCRYGNFLIGINRDQTKSYPLKTPASFTPRANLINGDIVSEPAMVPPQSTVVLYLDSATDSSPVPLAPLALNAYSDGTPRILLDWNPASGAASYKVKRALVSGGPYTAIANVTTTNYTDTSVASGVTYYYVVSGVNANGESDYNSMEFPVKATDLVAWWKFDETNGATAFDSSGNGNDATLQSAASW
ncbi:MAG TPA: fibronectin type III domain-containing protein, partial [Verrucomicrobiae bacterium]